VEGGDGPKQLPYDVHALLYTFVVLWSVKLAYIGNPTGTHMAPSLFTTDYQITRSPYYQLTPSQWGAGGGAGGGYDNTNWPKEPGRP
jgi:hypothetical protein